MLLNKFDKDMTYKLSTHRDWRIPMFRNPRLSGFFVRKVCLHDLEYDFFDENLEEKWKKGKVIMTKKKRNGWRKRKECKFSRELMIKRIG